MATQASVRGVDNAIAAQSKAQTQTEIARLEDRLRIARNGLANLNPNLQGNQAIIARYKNEVATIPGQITALKAQLAPKPAARKSGIVAQTNVRAGIIVEANPPTSVNTPESGQPSTPTTEKPLLAKNKHVGKPIYPTPITQTSFIIPLTNFIKINTINQDNLIF